MLTREALESSVALTERFDAKRFYLTPMANTPLAELVSKTGRPINSSYQGNGENNPEYFINQVMYLTDRGLEGLGGNTLHNETIEDVLQVCVPAVAGHINFAKTVVAPVVEDLVSRTTERLMHLTPSKLLGMEVCQYEAPIPLINSSIENFVRKFEETPFMEPPLAARLPDQTTAEIMELMRTGVSALDSDIQSWAAQVGEDFFIKLWEDIFQQRPLGLNDAGVKIFSDYTLRDPQASDYALAIFLITRKLVDAGALEGTEMSASLFENMMADYRNQAAAKLCRDLDAMDRDLKNGILVRNFTENTVTVNPRVYRKWLEDDHGENEILFGNLLRSQPYISVADINASAGDLKQAWERHSSLVDTVESNRRFNRIKEILQEVFQAQLSELTSEEVAILGNTQNVYNRFVDALAEVSQQDFTGLFDQQDFTCLYNLALSLVCTSRFAHTDAYTILKGIDNAKQMNPTLSVREAAAISVIEYISIWVAKQMSVQTATN